MQLTLATTAALLAVTISALPQPQGGGSITYPCDNKDEYHVDKWNEYDDKPQLVSGYRCQSTLSDSCSLAEQATYTKTVTDTVDTHASFSLDLSKVFTAGVDAGYSHSWATGNSTGTSATEQCPKGIVTCSLQVITKMVHQEGTVHRTSEGFGCLKKTDETYPFKVDGAKNVKDAPPNQQAIMTFSPCLVECKDKSCDDETVKALPKCPE